MRAHSRAHTLAYRKRQTRQDLDRSGRTGHRTCEKAPHTKEVRMLWVLAVLMAGLSFGYVTMRRKRKAAK